MNVSDCESTGLQTNLGLQVNLQVQNQRIARLDCAGMASPDCAVSSVGCGAGVLASLLVTSVVGAMCLFFHSYIAAPTDSSHIELEPILMGGPVRVSQRLPLGT